jgi:ABC-type branched-subunit amino acid transport system ATPase component/uncharacterized protein (UPF0261 family)
MHSTDTATRMPAGSRLFAESALRIESLDVYYGQAHALQGVSLSLAQGVLAVVGRNGMGKTTLCKAITGMVSASGSIQFAGAELLGRSPDEITRLGVAYVPQGRRVWRSLTVDETLRLASKTARQGAWTVERVYQVFPRLAERRHNGGGQLSGGEQQMLAIGRALLFNPSLLVMDEPTEGLAPVIVEQVATLLKALADERSMSVLLIEQNLGVALEVADQVAIMVNGRIAHCLAATELAADRALQQRLLGLKAGAADAPTEDLASSPMGAALAQVMRVVRAYGTDSQRVDEPMPEPAWRPVEVVALPPVSIAHVNVHGDRAVYLVGTWGTQARELAYAKRSLEELGARVVTVDIGTSGVSSAQVGVRELMWQHSMSDSQAPDLLAQSLAAYLVSRKDLGALLVVTRFDAATVACAGASALPLGVPKMVVCDRPLPGTDADVFVMTAPIGELNRVSEACLAHAASATAGMLRGLTAVRRASKPLVCITSLDLVSPTVRHVRRALGDAFDCLVLDMKAGGASTLTRLMQSGLIAGVVDLAPADVSQGHARSDLQGAARRFDALQASGVPYILVPSLLALAVFPVGQAVPAVLLQRDVRASALDGSLVPLSRDDAEGITDWLAPRMEALTGPVRVVLAQPSDDLVQGWGGGQQSRAVLTAINTGLARRIKPRRNLQVVEQPDALHDMRFGEALGSAMRDLIQNRVTV